MKLAKPKFDIGLATNNLEPMLAFWQGLRERIEHRADTSEAQGAARAAAAVFAHFLAVAEHAPPVPAPAGAAL